MSEPQTSDSEPSEHELTRLHEAMTATIKEAIPQLQGVESYPVLEEGMAMPLMIYAMTNVQPGEDPGDGRVCIVATFEACILVESARDKAPLQAAILATKLASLLHYQQWGLDFTMPVEGVQAMPTMPVPELAECAAWAVQWHQTLYLGDTTWLWENQPPGSLVFAFDPDTGPGNEDQYRAPKDLA
ncbi:hypothetical protein [Pseudomonas juntendi]|uniref:hypothetical protein n=1 Tax=Pseudomonas juntendi TaxID=2666183 RepID=UPI00244AFF7D|nr:hypothetical protein [Pseudomonas juntendi]MDG9891210.1 hypothetical protein [Pseudomonas juntendi]